MKEKIKIAVIGLGYVGLPLARSQAPAPVATQSPPIDRVGRRGYRRPG